MACKIYVKYEGTEFFVARCRDRKQAEKYWSMCKEMYRQCDGKLGNPIYVDTKKGREN